MASGSVAASMFGAGVMSAAKFAAAAFSGSSGMFAEGVRSAVNCGNSALMALGQRRSKKPPDTLHPFGYGPELYFWTLIVATVLFAVAGAGTAYKGVTRILDPQELKGAGWSYAVLAVAGVMAGRAWRKAYTEFRAGQGERPAGRALAKAKDPTTLTVLFDSTASLLGLLIAFLGIFLARRLGLPVLDGVASLLIGLLMAAVSVGLIVQSKQLLVGESAVSELKAAVCRTVEGDAAVAGVDDLLTMHLAPQDVLAVAVVRFRAGLSAEAVAEAVGRLTDRVRAEHPEVARLFVHPARGAGAGPAAPRGRELVTI